MHRRPAIGWLLFFFCGLLSGCALRSANSRQNPVSHTAPSISYLEQSTDAVQTLQTWYTPATGLYRSTGWWNSANAITVLADYARISATKQYDPVFANTFTAAQLTNHNFLNNYYDDEGWWALAWIDVYDVTGDHQYLSMAKTIFADMAEAWDGTCNGGIWWSKDRKYKNAIANELFLSVAAHLANRTSGMERNRYLAWSNKEWKWFRATGMINSKNLINDGLTIASTANGASCTNNGRTTWSYNQGVILGGLVELSAANHDFSSIENASQIASAAMSILVVNHDILHDSCEPHCGADGTQFKGIFTRNLVSLDLAHPRPAYKRFIDANAQSIWKHDQGQDFQLGEVWSGPFDTANASTQSSALDVLIAAAAIQKKN